jgi:Uma2 family endonuclease
VSIAVIDTPSPRIVLEGIGWQTFEALLRDLGDHHWRVTFDEGVLEFMSPHRPHERLKTLLARFIEALTLELGIEQQAGGSTTYKREDLGTGVEPDECYYIASEAAVRGRPEADLGREPPPDLVVEVDIGASSARRMKIYAAMGVPEVWRHDGTRLTIYRLAAEGDYREVAASVALPPMPVAEAERLLVERERLSDTAIVRAFLEHVRAEGRRG